MPRMTWKMPLAGTWSRLKILNMSFRFLTNSGERGTVQEIVTQSRNTAFQANLLKTSEEFAIIFRKELTSNIVNRLVADISVVTNLNGFQELGFGKLNALSEGLKNFSLKSSCENVISSPMSSGEIK